MGMNTEDWIAEETLYDCDKLLGLSLQQKNYSRPMVRITFGEQYIPIPQHGYFLNLFSAHSIKGAIMNYYREEASKILNIPIKEAPKYQVIDMKDPDMQILGDYIGQKIFKEGPYVVLGRVMHRQYQQDEESLWYVSMEISFENPKRIGEIQK